MTDYPGEIAAAHAEHIGATWLRTEVSYSRPVRVADGVGGSAEAFDRFNALTVLADPRIQENQPTMIVGEDKDIRIGDMVELRHSQFRHDN